MLPTTLPQFLPLALALSCSPGSEPASPARPSDGEFETHWYDGLAEVNGYHWSGSRYGELRTGESVAIFVTETIGAEDHVKIDRPEEHRGPSLTVLKLNLVRDFQTGLYDYDTMTSVFVSVNDMAPVKQSFCSMEWCGQVYEELNAHRSSLTLDVRSYFQGESVSTNLPVRPAGILGDHLLVWIRGLRGEVLAPGETRTFPYLADGFERRLRHAEARWGELEITRVKGTGPVQVAAGTFEARTFTLRSSDGRTGAIRLEEAYPHRILGWSWERGGEVLDAGELTGSERMKYWELHAEGQESLRARLGLTP
jgi:hypothetical protein